MRPKLTAEEYEGWCVSLVERMMEVLPPDNVCILYQTPGRYSGVGGAWLDKGFLCQLGARAAGAACVWQKVVLFDDCVTHLVRGSEPAYYACKRQPLRGNPCDDVVTASSLLNPGLYAYHIERFLSEFPRGQIYVSQRPSLS